jgi:hypothetical protein
MIRTFVAATLLAVSQIQAAEPMVPTLWELTLTRTDQANKILSQAKAPLAVYPAGDFDTSLPIDMGSPGKPRLWTVDCMSGGASAPLEFDVNDTTRTITGSSGPYAVELFDIKTAWHGAGRYLLFTLDGETLTADIHPAAGAKAENANESEAAVIMVTRRDRSRKILSQTTAPWSPISDDGEYHQVLAIQYGTKEKPQTRLVDCLVDPMGSRISFQTAFLLPVEENLSSTRVDKIHLLCTRAPINDAGKYLIHALDGETLEAEIRAAGGVKSSVPAGEK